MGDPVMIARWPIALVALMLSGAAAVAEQQLPQSAVDSKACAPGDRLQPGAQNPTAPPETTGENLSDKLARTDGVICPPNVDPDIKTPPPANDASRTPVIPPPGAPGGDQSVRPK